MTEAVSGYREEQLAGHGMVQAYFESRGPGEKAFLEEWCRDYLRFRRDVAQFQCRYLQSLCSASCFQQQRSACCSKDGIITFFADLVANALVSTPAELSGLTGCLRYPRRDMKCLYLGPQGCRWRLKPIVCEMFICDRAQGETFRCFPEAAGEWEALRARALSFRWPDRAVLFDEIETRFMAAGVRSSLMYLHHSPGLLRVKQKAGLL